MSGISTVNEEIAVMKAKISELEERIAAAETDGRSEEYIINLGQQLVAKQNELVELRKKENILLEQHKSQEIKSAGMAAVDETPTQDILIALYKLQMGLMRQTKVLQFVSKEVVIQHRRRMDIWSSSKRTRIEQSDFKASLIQYYQCQHATDGGLVKCMILNEYFPKGLVIASHIWKYCTQGEGLEEFGLKESDVNSPRNGILLCQEIEKAFDDKKLCFLIDRISSGNLQIKILDPALASELIISSHSSKTFADICGWHLQYPPNNMPYRRILDFHAKCSYRKAISRGWLAPDSTFDDFFDMSIESSIPDLYVYQIEDDDETCDD